MRSSTTVSISLVVLALLAPLQLRGWRGIVPLRSTRQDVERLIGSPMQPGGATYDWKGERVNVGYSSVPCRDGWPYGWDVSPDTVTSITVFPQKAPKLAELSLDLSKYTKFEDPYLAGVVYFNNSEEGLIIRTEGQSVVSLEYVPTAKDQLLLCPEAAKRELKIAKGEGDSIPPISYYLAVSRKEERTLIEIFHGRLKQYPADSIIYIIGYAGRTPCPNEAVGRAERAKRYLVSLGVSPQRIVTVDGGYAEPVWNEFYIVAPGKPKPLPHPNIYPGDVQRRTNCPSRRSLSGRRRSHQSSVAWSEVR